MHKILTGQKFEILVFVLTISSCSIIITQLFVSNESVLNALDTCDNIFLVLFVVEAVFKILTLGIIDYF